MIIQPIVEQRSVLVSPEPDALEGYHANPDLHTVREELRHWGRVPIDLERVRGMLVALERRLDAERERPVVDSADDLAAYYATRANRHVTLTTSNDWRFHAYVDKVERNGDHGLVLSVITTATPVKP